MEAADVTALTTAFDTSSLVSTFILLAPFILGVAGVIIAISLVKWGVKKIRAKLSGGVA
jgi:hypothetical protein